MEDCAFFKFRFFTAATSLLIVTGLLNAQDGAGGPSHVIVTYRVVPDKHGVFRSSLSSTVNRLTHWKDDGSVGGFAVLSNALIDDEAWESMAIVQLGGRGLEQIKRLEQPDSGMLAGTTTVPADLIESGTGEGEVPGTGVYLVTSYEAAGTDGSDDYRIWAKVRLAPLLLASMNQGGLLGYQVFLARFPAGRSWGALVVFHYRDWAAFGQGEPANPFPAVSRTPGPWRQRVSVVAEPAVPK